MTLASNCQESSPKRVVLSLTADPLSFTTSRETSSTGREGKKRRSASHERSLTFGFAADANFNLAPCLCFPVSCRHPPHYIIPFSSYTSAPSSSPERPHAASAMSLIFKTFPSPLPLSQKHFRPDRFNYPNPTSQLKTRLSCLLDIGAAIRFILYRSTATTGHPLAAAYRGLPSRGRQILSNDAGLGHAIGFFRLSWASSFFLVDSSESVAT